LLASRDKDVVRQDARETEAGVTPCDVIKDPYVLEFAGLSQDAKFRETELESALVSNMGNFMLELGKGFSFVGRQVRISHDAVTHHYIDLVFYNYILKCFVLIDLKTGTLSHGDIGQMDFYVRYYDGEIKREDDNPTIGIILCENKADIIVKYSVLSDNKNLFASKYMLYLPTEEELKAELLRERDRLETEKRLKAND
jgi:predicted nuclease of restriction endonuclease-like (RecB) superfamily